MTEDAPEQDWAWRRKLRSNPATRTAYRVVVFVVGLVIVLGGLALVPLPGPGWALVILGIAVWASEFDAARRVLDFAKAQLKKWNSWVMAQPIWVRGLVGLATAVLVVAVFWVLFKLSGVPGFLPDAVERWLHAHAGL